MSATFVWACEQTPGDPLAKNILFVLASFANWDTGECYPSIPTLQRISECGRNTVMRKLKDLERGGFIKISHREGSSNLITLVGYLEWRKQVKNVAARWVKRKIEKKAETKARRGSPSVGLVSEGEGSLCGTGGVPVGDGGSPCGGPKLNNLTNKLTNNSFSENKKEMERELSGLSKEEPRVEIRDNKIFLCKPLKEDWLKLFNNNEQDLDLALVQILPFLRDRNPAQLEVSVSSQLARICRERREKDARYAAASTKKEAKPFKISRWGLT